MEKDLADSCPFYGEDIDSDSAIAEVYIEFYDRDKTRANNDDYESDEEVRQ